MPRIIAFIIGLFVATLAGASALPLQTVYDDFGSGNAHQNSGVWFGTRPTTPITSAVEATRFVPSQGGQLSRLTTAMFNYPAMGVDEIWLSLRNEAAGAPGDVLWQATFDDMLPTSDASPALLPVTNGPQLIAGVPYWLVASAPSNTYSIWDSGLVGTTSLATRPVDSGTWRIYNGYPGRGLRVDVIPEPTAAITLMYLAALAMRPRRRRVMPHAKF